VPHATHDQCLHNIVNKLNKQHIITLPLSLRHVTTIRLNIITILCRVYVLFAISSNDSYSTSCILLCSSYVYTLCIVVSCSCCCCRRRNYPPRRIIDRWTCICFCFCCWWCLLPFDSKPGIKSNHPPCCSDGDLENIT